MDSISVATVLPSASLNPGADFSTASVPLAWKKPATSISMPPAARISWPRSPSSVSCRLLPVPVATVTAPLTSLPFTVRGPKSMTLLSASSASNPCARLMSRPSECTCSVMSSGRPISVSTRSMLPVSAVQRLPA